MINRKMLALVILLIERGVLTEKCIKTDLSNIDELITLMEDEHQIDLYNSYEQSVVKVRKAVSLIRGMPIDEVRGLLERKQGLDLLLDKIMEV